MRLIPLLAGLLAVAANAFDITNWMASPPASGSLSYSMQGSAQEAPTHFCRFVWSRDGWMTHQATTLEDMESRGANPSDAFFVGAVGDTMWSAGRINLPRLMIFPGSEQDSGMQSHRSTLTRSKEASVSVVLNLNLPIPQFGGLIWRAGKLDWGNVTSEITAMTKDGSPATIETKTGDGKRWRVELLYGTNAAGFPTEIQRYMVENGKWRRLERVRILSLQTNIAVTTNDLGPTAIAFNRWTTVSKWMDGAFYNLTASGGWTKQLTENEIAQMERREGKVIYKVSAAVLAVIAATAVLVALLGKHRTRERSQSNEW